MANNQELNLEQIDNIRKQGFRPQVVGCFVYEKKVLMVYKEKHKLWQIPQGGVDNNENLPQALQREMGEELGVKFEDDFEIIFLGEDDLVFPGKFQGTRRLKDDNGQEIKMIGKKYFFYAIKIKDKIDLTQTEFDDFKWLSYDQAIKLSESIYQKGKKLITIRALNFLRDKNLI